MTNEERFLGYLDSLKGSANEKLIECVQNGFNTLVEYQVVGNMSERGTDLMEGGEMNDDVPNEVVALIEKLTSEIEELRSAMQAIDDIADEHDNESYDTKEDLEVDEPAAESDSEEVEEVEEEREPVGESYEQAAEETETGGIADEKTPEQAPDVDPRDIDPIETGQRLGKVEGYGRDAVTEECESCGQVIMPKEVSGIMPENVQEGEAAGNVEEVEDMEGKMANRQLDQIADQSEKLAGAFGDAEELKGWVQAKITKAQQTIDSLYEYYREDKGLDEEPAGPEAPESSEEDTDENPIFEK